MMKWYISLKNSITILLMALSGGALFWIIDSYLDLRYFYRGEGAFIELLISDIPAHEIWVRLVVIIVFLIGGILMMLYVNKLKREYYYRQIQQQAIIMKEKRYRSLIESMNEGIALHEPVYDHTGRAVDYRILEVNRRYEEITGLTRDEALMSTASEIYHQDTAPYLDIYQRVTDTGVPESFETYYEPLGKYLSISVFRPEPGQFATVFEDITVRKLYEQEKEETQRKLKTLLGNLPGMAYRCENEPLYTMKFVSEGCKTLTGYSEDELTNNSKVAYGDLIHPDDKEMVWKTIQASVEQNEPFKLEYRIKTTGNSEKWVWEKGVGIPSENGKVNILEGFISDITELKEKEKKIQKQVTEYHALYEEYLTQSEELTQTLENTRQINKELEEARKKAEEGDRLKSAFLANMSHEIRTPLNGIVGFAELFDDPEIDDKDSKRYRHIIKENSHQLLNIVSDLLDISKLDAGQIELYEEAFSLNGLMDELFETLQLKAGEHGIELRVQKDLGDKKAYIRSDKYRLMQIINNLVSNALKFTDEGYVKYGYRLKQKNLEFYVEDTGIGIRPEMQEKIFERFRQADLEITKIRGGTGLGLTITKNLVEIMGGKIWLESEKGKGSIFYFNIPYKPAHEFQKEAVSDTTVLNEHDVSSTHVVLIVEDEESNFDYMSTILKRMNLKVIGALTGEEAIEKTKKHPEIELILMDIKLPVLNGYEAIREIRKDHPHIPIVAQTAFASEKDRITANEAGCDDYLVKPIRSQHLKDMIKKYVHQ
ncbi:MAG: response regulator [Bacteroidales bacterium]|nr:response regulator [Bacteroidales bacterium]